MAFSRRLSTAFLTLFVVMLTTAGLAVLAVASASAAHAHSELVSSTPAEGDSISEIPSEIVLEFNEDIQAIGNEIVVVDPEGTPVASGETVVEGPIVTQPIGVGAAGPYTVTWRVVSADGHPISGEFSYELRVPQTVPTSEDTTESSPVTTQATESSADATETEAPSSSSDADEEESGSGATVPVLVGLAVLVLAGVVVLVVRRRRAR